MATSHRARPRLMPSLPPPGTKRVSSCRQRSSLKLTRSWGVIAVMCWMTLDRTGPYRCVSRGPRKAAQHILDYARSQPLDAILPIGDTPVLTAALANQALHFQHHSPDAAAASRNKFLMRQLLRNAGLRVPWFTCFPMQNRPRVLQNEVLYPVRTQTAGAVSQSWRDADNTPRSL